MANTLADSVRKVVLTGLFSLVVSTVEKLGSPISIPTQLSTAEDCFCRITLSIPIQLSTFSQKQKIASAELHWLFVDSFDKPSYKFPHENPCNWLAIRGWGNYAED